MRFWYPFLRFISIRKRPFPFPLQHLYTPFIFTTRTFCRKNMQNRKKICKFAKKNETFNNI